MTEDKSLYDHKEIVVSIPFKMYMVGCQNKECTHRFSLFAIQRYTHDYDDEVDYTYIPQVEVYYCPYCGTPNEKLVAKAQLPGLKGTGQ